MDMPVKMRWEGDCFIPASQFWQRQADLQFVVGQTYRLTEENERSDVSHKHEFAFLKEAWNSFPDHLVKQFPSPEHLRKFGLIRKGFHTMVQHVCASNAEATRLQATLGHYVDRYAIVERDDSIVTVFTALSQGRNKMNAKRFQESKQALIEFVADLIEVDPETLARQTEAA